ncbi:MAG: tetratricopeptide repeat protein [Candidatus Zixiibacteriota bacterium]
MMDPRAYDYYIDGLLLEGMGDPVQASRSFLRALQYYPDSYEIGFALAETYYGMQQPTLALEALSRLVPRTVNVYLLSAACYRAMGDDNAARSTYLKLLQLDSANATALGYLANSYQQRNDPDSMMWAMELLAQRSPEANSRLWNELGKLRAQRGNLDGAKEAFQRSLELDRSAANVLAYAGLGDIYDLMHRTDSAASYYLAGLRVDGDNVLLNRQLISLYLSMDSLRLALPYAQKVVELAPLDRVGVRRLAVIYFGLDSLKESDSLFSYLVSGGERNASNHYYLGTIALREHDYTRAKSEFTTLTDLADTLSESWLNLGFAYRQLNDTNHEIATYQAGLNHMRDENNAVRVFFALGAAYERYGQFDSSVAVFEKLISKAPDHSQALNYLGYMLADRNQRLDYARELIGRALAIDSTNGAFLDSYGWVYYRLGDFDKALEYLTRAAESTEDAVVFEHVGDTYNARGDRATAHKWWRKALDLTPTNDAIKEKLAK